MGLQDRDYRIASVPAGLPFEQQVEHLDAMARQPQSGQMQEWLRGERQKARDRQFALPC